MAAECGGVARIGIERQAILAENRLLLWKAVRLLIVLRERTGLVLARFDIRLIERVDADDCAGYGDRDLPAEELLADMPNIRHADPHDRMASPLQRRDRLLLSKVNLPIQLQVDEESVAPIAVGARERLPGQGNQAPPLLTGAFGEKLLQPCAQIGDSWRRDDRYFVATEPRRGDTECDAELDPRILNRWDVRTARALHLPRRVKQPMTSTPIAAAGAKPNFDSTE